MRDDELDLLQERLALHESKLATMALDAIKGLRTRMDRMKDGAEITDLRSQVGAARTEVAMIRAKCGDLRDVYEAEVAIPDEAIGAINALIALAPPKPSEDSRQSEDRRGVGRSGVERARRALSP